MELDHTSGQLAQRANTLPRPGAESLFLTDRLDLLVSEFGPRLEVLTTEDKYLLMAAICITLYRHQRTVAYSLRDGCRDFPYTVTGRVVRAIAILTGATDHELHGLLESLSAQVQGEAA